jgi:hypothetical protein
VGIDLSQRLVLIHQIILLNLLHWPDDNGNVILSFEQQDLGNGMIAEGSTSQLFPNCTVLELSGHNLDESEKTE